MIKCVCTILFVFREWWKREGTNIFALKENSVYNNQQSNTGCYEVITPSLLSPGCLFAEAACSSEPAQQALTIPIRMPELHLRCLSLQDIHSPALTKLPASKGGLLIWAAGFPPKLDSDFRADPQSNHRSHYHQSRAKLISSFPFITLVHMNMFSGKWKLHSNFTTGKEKVGLKKKKRS